MDFMRIHYVDCDAKQLSRR